MAETTLKIEGMSCMHCVGRVKQAIAALSGVQEAKVEVGTAQVSFDDSAVSVEAIAEAVVKSGYKVVG
ncbi:hypothetical protein LCGC14_2914760, partial [marine sediment metagenome]